MADISKAYQWAINTCNAANVGYSQDYRNQQTVGNITYYDCSSFIWYSLIAGGFDCVAANSGSAYPFTTSSMGEVLTALGFKVVLITDEWKAGDILWRNGHTEMVFDGRTTMGAHSSSYELERQVSINTYESSSDDWSICYRYGSGASGTYTWIKGNRYLSTAEMQNNAACVFNYLFPKGWTINSIAGMLGNMQSESTINPGIWQKLIEGSGGGGGYGLVQWTPWTNYTDWADANGYSWDDGNAQLKWIDEVTVSVGQWIPTDLYPLSFTQFKTSIDTPENLASAFLKNFERAGVEVEEERRTQARYWFSYLQTLDSSETITGKIKRKKYNFLLFNKNRRFMYGKKR